jgi:hypothetical protein
MPRRHYSAGCEFGKYNLGCIRSIALGKAGKGFEIDKCFAPIKVRRKKIIVSPATAPAVQ